LIAQSDTPEIIGTTIPDKILNIVITTNNSIRVKPCFFEFIIPYINLIKKGGK